MGFDEKCCVCGCYFNSNDCVQECYNCGENFHRISCHSNRHPTNIQWNYCAQCGRKYSRNDSNKNSTNNSDDCIIC